MGAVFAETWCGGGVPEVLAEAKAEGGGGAPRVLGKLVCDASVKGLNWLRLALWGWGWGLGRRTRGSRYWADLKGSDGSGIGGGSDSGSSRSERGSFEQQRECRGGIQAKIFTISPGIDDGIAGAFQGAYFLFEGSSPTLSCLGGTQLELCPVTPGY